MRVRQLVILGMLSAVLVAAQVTIAVLPNIELVTPLIIIFTLLLGSLVFAPIYAFVLVEGLIYGFGLWWINYLYVWSILALAVLLLRKQKSPAVFAVLGGAFGLLFGALCAVPYFFIGGPASALAYWISGIPFDLIHCLSNTVVTLLLFVPLYRLCARLIGDTFGEKPDPLAYRFRKKQKEHYS